MRGGTRISGRALRPIGKAANAMIYESGEQTHESSANAAGGHAADLLMDNSQGHDPNADQIAYWNGPAGQRWADRQQAQDILLGPVADILIDRAKLKAGERVIDIGCGSESPRSRSRKRSDRQVTCSVSTYRARCWRGRG